MNRICFKFAYNPKEKEPKIKRPYVVLEFQAENGEWFKEFMLADTGADLTSLPRGVCEILGKKVEKGKE